MKKQLYLILLCGSIGSALPLSAQQFPWFAQEPEQHGIINPGSLNQDYLRKERVLSFGGSYRRQWSGLGDVAPTTSVFRAEYIDDDDDRFFNPFFGAYTVSDQVGLSYNGGIYVRGGIVRRWGEYLSEGGFSVGFNVGTVNRVLRTQLLDPTNLIDPNIPNNRSVWHPDAGVGLFVYKKVGTLNIYGGASLPRLLQYRSEKLGLDLYRHYYGLAGCYWTIRDNSYAEFSTWFRYVENIPGQFSFNLRGQFSLGEDSPVALGGGLGCITNASFHKSGFILLPQFHIMIRLSDKQQLRVGYSFISAATSKPLGSSNEFNVALVMDLKER